MNSPLRISFVILLAFLSYALYLNSLDNAFVKDDNQTIIDNTMIRDWDNMHYLVDIRNYFASSGEMTYRPVVTLSYFMDYAVHGMSPRGYHLTNILLHTINGVLLYIFLSLTLRNMQPNARVVQPGKGLSFQPGFNLLPLLSAIVFISHPVLSEAVNAVSYREDLLSFAFYMSALVFYSAARSASDASAGRGRINIIYFVSCVSYFLSLLSKEMAVTLPLTVMLIDISFFSARRTASDVLFNRFNLGYIVITVLYLYIRFAYFENPFYDPADRYGENWGTMERLYTIPLILFHHIRLSLFPVGLSAVHSIDAVSGFQSPSFFMPLAFIAGIIILSLYFLRRFPTAVFGALFFFSALIPVSNLAAMVVPFAERYLYLPLAGMTITAASLILAVIGRSGVYAASALFLIVGLNSWNLFDRNSVWKDDLSLWSDAAAKMPDSFESHLKLGLVQYRAGNLNESIKNYKAAVSLNPSNPGVYTNLGSAYADAGQTDLAVANYEIALRLKPLYVNAHHELGLLYEKSGELEKAAASLQKALELNPSDPLAHYNLGNVHYKDHAYDMAIRRYEAAIRLNPYLADAHYNLGQTYFDLNRFSDAVREFEAADRIKHGDPELNYMMGTAYEKMGLNEEAMKNYREAVKLARDYSEARLKIEALEKKTATQE